MSATVTSNGEPMHRRVGPDRDAPRHAGRRSGAGARPTSPGSPRRWSADGGRRDVRDAVDGARAHDARRARCRGPAHPTGPRRRRRPARVRGGRRPCASERRADRAGRGDQVLEGGGDLLVAAGLEAAVRVDPELVDGDGPDRLGEQLGDLLLRRDARRVDVVDARADARAGSPPRRCRRGSPSSSARPRCWSRRRRGRRSRP